MKRPPSYDDLAIMVKVLTEHNVANLDHSDTTIFVKCFTYGPGNIPAHWRRAIIMREALIENRIIKRA